MQKNFEQLLKELREMIAQMTEQTEDAVIDSIEALKNRDVELAQDVIHRDDAIDKIDVDIDELVSNILARQQPVAKDLRMIIGSMKIAHDLERISDHAVNIAESAISLSKVTSVPEIENLTYMSNVVKSMLVGATESLMEQNTIMARGVLNSDDEVDEYNREITIRLTDGMSNQKIDVKVGMELVRVCKNLERIGDLSTNISEDVIYINDAKFVKREQH